MVLVEREIEERLDHEETVEDGHDCIDGILFFFSLILELFVRKSGSSASLRKDKTRGPRLIMITKCKLTSKFKIFSSRCKVKDSST